MNPRIQHLDKYVTARPIQPDVSVASPPAMPEGLARRSSGAMRSLLALAFMTTVAHAQDANIFIGDLSLDQYIDARVHAAPGH